MFLCYILASSYGSVVISAILYLLLVEHENGEEGHSSLKSRKKIKVKY